MRTFDGQNLWVTVGLEGGMFTGYDAGNPKISVVLIDWDMFNTREENAEDIGERLGWTFAELRQNLPPGKHRKQLRRELMESYREERPLGTRWWDAEEKESDPV